MFSMTNAVLPSTTIPEALAIGLWTRRTHLPERQRLMLFCNDLLRVFRSGQVPTLPRTHLSELKISTGVYNALRRAGFTWVDEVELLNSAQLMLIHRIGELGAAEIRHAIRLYRNRLSREEAANTPETLIPLPPAIPEVPVEEQIEQAKSLMETFYVWKEDHERLAAVLTRAAELIDSQGHEGPNHLRNLALRLLEGVQ